MIELSCETAREAVYATVLTISRNPMGMTDPRRAICLEKAHDLLGQAMEQEEKLSQVVDSAALARTARLLHLTSDLCNEAAKLDEPRHPKRMEIEVDRVELA